MAIKGKIKSIKLGIFPMTLYLSPDWNPSNFTKIIIKNEEDLEQLRNDSKVIC